MGSQPTKEKLLKLITECSKTNYYKNMINRIEYHNDLEMDLDIEDDEILYNKYHSQDNIPIFFDISNPCSFPYVAFGTIFIKFQNDEKMEQICFLVYKNIIVTYFPFSDNKNIIEVRTSFSEEIINLNSYKIYEKKNLAIFFLENQKYSEWIGVEQYTGYLDEQKIKYKLHEAEQKVINYYNKNRQHNVLHKKCLMEGAVKITNNKE